jgi:hypothetical protein
MEMADACEWRRQSEKDNRLRAERAIVIEV